MQTFNPQPKVTKKALKSEKKRLQAKCWKLMSEWIRRKNASFSGMNVCFTCGKTHHWKEMHCGHFQHGKLDLDERNLKPQCVKCNTYQGGKLDIYTLHLISQNDEEWVRRLMIDAARHPGYTPEEMKTIKEDLTRKLSSLQTNGNVI